MASVNKSGSRILGVKPAIVEEAKTFLQELPDKPKEDLSLKEAVERMKEPLQAALGKGYSYDSLAKILSDKGIKISALTLKNYLPSGRRAATKAKATKTKKATPDAAPETNAIAPEPVIATATAPAVEPTPKKATGGRTKAAAKAKTETPAQSTTAQTPPAAKAPPSRRRRLAKP